MQCWGFLLVFCSWLIISSLAHDDANDVQECPGGFCLVKDRCPNGMYDETYAQTNQIINLRVSNVCREGKVCCRNETSVHNYKTNLNIEKTMEYACGVNNPDGIGNQVEVNPAYAKYGEYPWVVAIFRQETILGGGTLIHPRFVLTAAHIFNSKDNLVARFGDWDLEREENVLPKQNINIQKVVDHPEYQSVGLMNDIALAHLEQYVQYDKHIRPICLPDPADLFDAQQCIATGWGSPSHSPTSIGANVLKRVELSIIPRQKCKQLFAATRLGIFFRLHKSVLCAGAKKDEDTCYGDGGSGLYCPTESGSYVLAGIVSWGLGCGQENVPGAYVNVARFVPWINNTIEESV